MSVPDELRNIRDHLRSGRFGQREVWEQQLEKAAVEFERRTKEAADYKAEGERHIQTIAQLRYEKTVMSDWLHKYHLHVAVAWECDRHTLEPEIAPWSLKHESPD